MPDHADWPPGPRALERVSRLLGYAAIVVAGYGVLTTLPVTHTAAVQFLGLLAVARAQAAQITALAARVEALEGAGE